MTAVAQCNPLWRRAALVVLVMTGAVAQAAPPRYHATALSSGNSQAYGLNRLGDVSLAADDLGGLVGAWVDGMLVPVPLGSGSRPSGDGKVGVLVDNGDGRQRPGLFDLRSGTTIEVGPPHSLPPIVMDANVSGVAVGFATEAPPNAKVFLGGSEIDLGQGSVNAINHSGAVAGTLWAYDPLQDTSAWRAFAAGPGLTSLQWIAPFAGGLSSEARDISGSLVVGSSDVAAGSGSQAFVHHLRSGRTQPLPALGGSWSGALGVNQQDWIVGWSTSPGDADYRAALWTSRRRVHDLNALSDVPAGWTLYEAVDINPQGQIVANAMDASGAIKAFLLAPVQGARVVPTAQRPAVSRQRLCAQVDALTAIGTRRQPAACRGIRAGR
ncbi:MAG: hypothetical protein J0M20_11850 [Burkholderiales bacterium]|nr:hypothetical protein [Burkholderiales bacterium]